VLENLPDIANHSAREHLLRQLLPRIDDSSKYSIHRLAYKPERRYVGQLQLDGRPQAVLRFYTEDDFLGANRNAKVLRPGKTLRLAKRLGRSKHHAVIALEWLEGMLLSEALADESFDPSYMSRVG